MSVEPITPEKALRLRRDVIPDVVIETVNEILVEKIESTGRACFTKTDLILRLVGKGVPSKDILEDTWLAFSHVFEKAGWIVVCERPDQLNIFDITWTFRKRKTCSTY